MRLTRDCARWRSAPAAVSTIAIALTFPAGAAAFVLRVDTDYDAQRLRANGVLLGSHGGAQFGVGPALVRHVRNLTCVDDGSPHARFANRHAVFAVSSLALDAVCDRDAVELPPPEAPATGSASALA